MRETIGREWGGGVAILSAAPEPRALRDSIERLAARWPMLRRIALRRSGASAALPSFDLDYHLRWETLGAGDDLVQVATQRFFEPLDPRRPGWELHVLARPDRALLLVKMDRRLAIEGDPAPLLGALAGDTPRAAPTVPTPREDRRPGVFSGLTQMGDTLLGAWRALQSSEARLRESAALLATARGMPQAAAVLREMARRAASSIASTLSAPLANPSPSALIGSVAGSLRLALVDLPAAALDAASAQLGLGLDDVLVSIGAATVARLDEDNGVAQKPMRALVAGKEQRRLLPAGSCDPLENARELRRLLEAPPRGVPALPALGAAMTETDSRVRMRQSRLYDLSVCYDESPLAGREIAGARILRVYPIGATPRSTRLAIGAQRCGDGLSLGLTFSSAVAREPAALLEAFEIASAQFVRAAHGAPRPASHAN